ncbi:MAG: ABC transporter ATP-binding protein [Nitratireductor sp.]|nr:ABC transporter ATP-binding protein [Nitratireductor sp.]
MTTLPSIRLDKANLYYSSLAYGERSLKSLLFGHGRMGGPGRLRDVHALRDISFTLRAGERVGILGANGAGKSTLLKLLAGLYPLRSGTCSVNGNVRAMLDLMLGFEPEATGRQNILYRGLILGLSPSQVRELEAGIIEFADIGEFIDYPVKTYSAGMSVRLAFAISTAVHGDILLIDEVIGAGDGNFMEKARIRFRELVNQSQILVIASHDHHTLGEICTRGIVLEHGRLAFDGKFADAVAWYGAARHTSVGASRK